MKHRLTQRFWTSRKVDQWDPDELVRLTEALRQEVRGQTGKRSRSTADTDFSGSARAYRASRRGRTPSK